MAAALPFLAQTAAAVLPSLFNKGGSSSGLKKLPTMTKGQQGIQGQLERSFGGQGGGLEQILNQLMMQLQGGGALEEALGNQYMQNFQEQTLPGIAERFAGGGALSSSGFGQSLGAAGAGLQNQLATLRAGQGQDALQKLIQLLQFTQTSQPFDYLQKQKGAGMGGGIAQGISNITPGAWQGAGEGAMDILVKILGAGI